MEFPEIVAVRVEDRDFAVEFSSRAVARELLEIVGKAASFEGADREVEASLSFFETLGIERAQRLSTALVKSSPTDLVRATPQTPAKSETDSSRATGR